jgi:PST family polysaccharide transporter
MIPYLVRVLGTENFGKVMFAQSIASICTLISDFGISVSGTRTASLSKNKNKLSSLFWDISAFKGIIVFILFFILYVLILVFPKLSADSRLYFYSFGATIGTAMLPAWYFQGIQKMKVIAILNALAKITFSIFIIINVTNPKDYLLVPLYNSLGFIFSGILGFIYAANGLSIIIPSQKRIRSIAKESTPLFFSTLSTSLYTYLNIVVIGILTNNIVTGIYASLEKVVLALKGLYTPIYQAIFPWLSQKKDTGVFIKKISYYVCFFGVVGTATLIFFSDHVLALIFDDPQITSYSLAFQIFSLVLLISGLNMLYNFLYLSSTKRYILRLKILGTTGLLSLFSTITATHFFGIYGTISSVVFSELLLLFWGHRTFSKLEK